jgi:hypothetical protein
MTFKKKILTLLILPLLLKALPPGCVITYRLGGRFGDNIMVYLLAKCIAHKYVIPLLYKQIEYSDLLQLHYHESLHYEKKQTQKLHYRFPIFTESNLLEHKHEKTLFISSLKFRAPETSGTYKLRNYLQQNQELLKNIKYMLTPLKKPNIPLLPKNKLTIALHVRKGDGFDEPLKSQQYYSTEDIPTYVKQTPITKVEKRRFSDKRHPLRFPPEQFYVDQLKQLAKDYPDQQLYVFIFSDEKDLKSLCNRLKIAINNTNITFDYRKDDPSQYIIDDWIAIQHFDVLIRPASSYSKTAQILGNNKLVIHPTKWYWWQDRLIIEEVKISHQKSRY